MHTANRNIKALSNTELGASSKAIFANRAHKRCSDKYGFISTQDLVTAFRKAGFVAVQAGGQRTYKNGNNDVFGRHMIRFRPVSSLTAKKVGEVVPEVVLYNSHNGRGMYRLMAGLFRFVCENGLIVASHSFGEVRVRHHKEALTEVLAASHAVLKSAEKSLDLVQRMEKCKLNEKQLADYASKALKLRYADTSPVKADTLLVSHRKEDEPNDMWHVFNRVQENLVRGGMVGQSSTGRVVTVRRLTNIKRDVQVNYDLWGMTNHYMNVLAARKAA